jgi:pyrroloquinoline quinone biosynthesis protein D
MMTEHCRPTLAAKARLRFDRREGRFWLLYPERGLLLNQTAGEILHLCTGRLTVDLIVDVLATRHDDSPRAVIKTDVVALLSHLQARGLVQE